MGIFDNYQDLDNAYVPNNLSCSFPIKKPCCKPQFKKPYEEYNAEGKLIGYYWYYGDTVSLQFDLTGEIIVESDDIIYSAIGQKPDEQTFGYIGTKAYNVIDMISWTLVSISNDRYIWQQDEEFQCPNNGQRNVYFTIDELLKGKYISITIVNFRKEPIYQKTFEGNSTIILDLDKELSSKLCRGVYHCQLYIYSEDDNLVLSPEGLSDLSLTVR